MTSTRRPTVGMVYPGHAAEDEYPAAARTLDVHLPVAHVYGTDLHAVPELLDLGSPERLAGGAEQLARHRPDAVMWACTSGSFVYGRDGAREQAAALARVTGVPTSSTGLAFVAALEALGASRVAVAATYPQDVAELFGGFLTAAGVEVVSLSGAGIVTAAEVGTLPPEEVVDLAVHHDHPRAEVLLVPDTAMRTLHVLPALESRLGRPVLTANQVTIWYGLLLAGARPHAPTLGTLFARKQDHAHQ